MAFYHESRERARIKDGPFAPIRVIRGHNSFRRASVSQPSPPGAPWARAWAWSLLLVAAGGCNGVSSSLVVARDLNPEEVATRAMSMYDANSDGSLDAAELEGSLSLSAAMQKLDADKSKSLSSAEIASRFKAYQEQSDLMGASFELVNSSGPVANATVVFTSAPFVVDPPMTFRGSSNEAGIVTLEENNYGVNGMPIGLYEIEVTGPVQTKIGYELAEDSSAHGRTRIEL